MDARGGMSGVRVVAVHRVGAHREGMSTPPLTVPDSALATGAGRLLDATAAPWLVAHSHRTFHLGCAAAARAGRRPDPELTFVAAMLHDLALATGLDDDPDADFQVIGARLAERYVLDQGRPDADAAIVRDAIALHLEITSADDPRDEVAAVHLGALIDVVGLRLEDVPAELVDAVLAHHPRLGAKAALRLAFEHEIDRRPTGAFAQLRDRFGFADLIAAAPYDE